MFENNRPDCQTGPCLRAGVWDRPEVESICQTNWARNSLQPMVLYAANRCLSQI